ncbi:MAG: PAS domain S-box protein, partial [Deltaproteobacteria bacterium]|nr:PAS domain S-box protein [Deltaproteobacteria bacterium]
MESKRINIKAKSLQSVRSRKSYQFRFRLLGSIVIFLILLGLILGVFTAHLLRNIISEDFNQQQLILARHIARMVDQNIQFLKRELISLSLSPSLADFRKTEEGRMETTLETVKNSSVIAIILFDPSGNILKIVGAKDYIFTKITHPHNHSFLRWCLIPKNRYRVLIQPFEPAQISKDKYLCMIMATSVSKRPLELDSDDSGLKPAGVIAFLIDSTKFMERFTKDIRSGKTGYAWVIDNNGNFVVHLEKDFIGENAFLVRKARDPSIDFIAVNTIQKEEMLKGEEGTGWYYSGWHRGNVGKMKKFIAFTPIHLGKEKFPYFWSVAVAAPTSEVENVVHSVYIPMFIGSVVLILVIVMVGFYLIDFGRSLTRTLEEEVRSKTGELAQSEDRYRTYVEKSRDLIFTVDPSGKFRSLNQYGADLFGKKQEEYIGQGLEKAFSPESASRLLKIVREVIETGQDIQLEHDSIVGGKLFWFLSHLIPLSHEGGKPSMVLVFSRNVTSRHQIREQEILRTEKLASIGTLAAGVAHEINNPIC